MVQTQDIAAAGEILVVALLAGHEPVIGEIVDAPKAQRRAHLIALGRVIVDHVENDLDAGVMEVSHRRLEFVDVTGREKARIGRKEADRIVSPIVDQIVLDEMAVVDKSYGPAEVPPP